MPNCFTLTRKGEDSPTPLSTIDKEICNLLNVEVHPRFYCTECNWFDTIGFFIATGIPLHSEQMMQKIVDHCNGFLDTFLKVLRYLRDNYTDDAFATIGK